MSDHQLSEVLDVLCPMHLIVDGTGHISHAGSTAAKLGDGADLVGKRVLEVFEIKRPRRVNSMDDFRQVAGRKLHLRVRDGRNTALKGVMVPLPGGDDRLIVNLSFGISVMDGVRDYSLTNADFAATDLAIEMLYLVEAKTAAMEASRRLNLRLQEAKTAAEQQAYTDTLTGLRNRRAMDNVLERLLASGDPFAVMHIDLDFFKDVNDTLGHAAGDHVLQTVARIMVEETRETDCVARVGGDEFTIILPNVRNHAILRRIGDRIISCLEVPIPFEGDDCNISASIGTVWIRSGRRVNQDTVLSDADVALYASKRAGRARQTFYTPELREQGNANEAPKGRGQRATDVA